MGIIPPEFGRPGRLAEDVSRCGPVSMGKDGRRVSDPPRPGQVIASGRQIIIYPLSFTDRLTRRDWLCVAGDRSAGFPPPPSHPGATRPLKNAGGPPLPYAPAPPRHAPAALPLISTPD